MSNQVEIDDFAPIEQISKMKNILGAMESDQKRAIIKLMSDGKKRKYTNIINNVSNSGDFTTKNITLSLGVQIRALKKLGILEQHSTAENGKPGNYLRLNIDLMKSINFFLKTNQL